jgi:hypothetical protein
VQVRLPEQSLVFEQNQPLLPAVLLQTAFFATPLLSVQILEQHVFPLVHDVPGALQPPAAFMGAPDGDEVGVTGFNGLPLGSPERLADGCPDGTILVTCGIELGYPEGSPDGVPLRFV